MTKNLLYSMTVASLFAMVGSLGCSREPAGPPTVAVKGKLVSTRGVNVADLHNREGAIEFQSVEQPDVKAYGELEPDGSFTLTTSKDDVFKNGVVTGTHRVRLLLDEQAATFVDPRFLRFETSPLTADIAGDQELVLEVWR